MKVNEMKDVDDILILEMINVRDMYIKNLENENKGIKELALNQEREIKELKRTILRLKKKIKEVTNE